MITIAAGPPASIVLTSNPGWVGGNRHAEVDAHLVDAFGNGVAGLPLSFLQLTGTGTLTPRDSVTDSTGVAHADFLSPRQPEKDRVQAIAGPLTADLWIETAFVDPNAGGGTVASYPNPFHPGEAPVTLAWKLDDFAAVTLRIFTQTGDLVLERHFERGTTGGMSGLNVFPWDGRNGRGDLVASGGYIALIEAQGQGETLHVMRRKLAAVR